MKVLGMQHVGFTVPDLDAAVAFFTTLFGAVECLSSGRVDVDDDFMRKRLGVPGQARMEKIAVLRVGNGSNLEIFQFSGDSAADEPLKRNSQPGGFHLGFQVDDCMAAAKRLREAGVDVLEGPDFIEAGPLQGLTWCYLRTPWGQYLEIISMDGPLGAERDGAPAQWSPV